MTNEERLAALQVLISPDTTTDDLLMNLLDQAEGIVLNRRYPFGVPENTVLSPQYEKILIRVALELYSKMGAEGQTAHDENGVKRTWEAADVSPSLLKMIVPVCGSVV